MGRRLRLLGAVVVLLAVGAAGIGLRDQVELSGGSPLAPDPMPVLIVVFGLSLVAFVLLMATSRKPGRGPQQRRSRSLLGTLGAVAVAALLFYLAVTYGPEERPVPFEGLEPGQGTGSGPAGSDRGTEAETSLTTGLILAALLVLVVVGPAVLLWWRSRPNRTESQTSTAADLRVVIAEGQAALSGTADPRAAVISAYAAMETALVRAGLDRRIADTPTELLNRAGEAGFLAAAATAAAERLTGLFARARFSDRPLPESARVEALAALRQIDQDLAAAVAAAEAEAASAATTPDPPGGSTTRKAGR